MYCSRSWLAEFHAIFPCAKTLAFSIHFRMDSSISLYSSKCEDAWKVSSTQMNVNPFWRVGNSSLSCVFGCSHPREWQLSLWHWKGSWKVTCLWKICQKFPSALRVINQVHNTFISLFLTLHSHLILFIPFYHLSPSHWVKKVWPAGTAFCRISTPIPKLGTTVSTVSVIPVWGQRQRQGGSGDQGPHWLWVIWGQLSIYEKKITKKKLNSTELKMMYLWVCM